MANLTVYSLKVPNSESADRPRPLPPLGNLRKYGNICLSHWLSCVWGKRKVSPGYDVPCSRANFNYQCTLAVAAGAGMHETEITFLTKVENGVSVTAYHLEIEV